MTTYHRLLLLTTLGSAVLTFCLLQTAAVNSSATQQNPPQQLQSTPLPQATEYYALGQPRLMTLVWQPCHGNVCQPGYAHYQKTTARSPSNTSI